MSRGSQGELFGPEAAKQSSRKSGKRSAGKKADRNRGKADGQIPAQEAKGGNARTDGGTGASPGKAANRSEGASPPPAGIERAGQAAGVEQVGDHTQKAHQSGAKLSDNQGEQSAHQAQGNGMASGARKGKQKSRSQGARRKPTTRKKTAAKSRRKGQRRWALPSKRWGLVFYGAAALAVLVLLFLWSQTPDDSYQPSTAFMNGKAPSGGSILYEEPMPKGASKALPDLSTIDEAIFSALRQAGVPPQETHLALAHGPHGEVSLIKAQLPSKVPLGQAAAMLEKALAGTKAKGVWHRNGHNREFSVSLAGKLTHKVLLESGRPLKPPAPAEPSAPPQPAPPTPAVPSTMGPRLAIIIDDIGYQFGPAKELINLGIPLTLSILPHSPHGRKVAQMARKRGLEVMLHLPMEPRGYPGVKPGPGALLTSMTPEQLRQTTLDDLASVPGAKGTNNHMGSLFTERDEALRPVMQVLSEKGIFFIDSMTSPNSRAYSVARNLGLVAARRTIFLDHDPSLTAVRRQLQRILSMARRGSQIVAIGHPHKATIQALAEFGPRLKKDVNLVTASQFLRGTALAGGRGSAAQSTGGQLDRPAAVR